MSDVFGSRVQQYGLIKADVTKVRTGREEWSWNKRLAITVVFFVVLRWRTAVFETSGVAATPTKDLVDYADVLFSSRAKANKLRNAISVYDRPDISSFGFDLGGSTCACQLQWDVKQYWQRVFYGPKYA